MDANLKALLIVSIALLSILALYTAYDKASQTLAWEKLARVLSFEDPEFTFSELNKAAALAAILILSLVFIIGPLSKIFPKTFSAFLVLRKPLGLAGFGIALLHAAYSAFVMYGLDIQKMVSGPAFIPLSAGAAALLIFFIMAVTSTKEAVRTIGYRKWKTLQTLGYFALFLSALHFFLIESKPGIGFDVRPYGLLIFFVALIALVLRVAVIFMRKPERKGFEEHFGG